ncbi:MAG: hypothetical protein HUU16_19060, partial [Candidatus Omnitrophica bacterium]|nr:hypothetical protein [Candidatus Omnitrophota bacterium]
MKSFRNLPTVESLIAELNRLPGIGPKSATALAYHLVAESPERLRALAETDSTVVITTDHGCVLTSRASMAYGNRDTSTGLRFKYGKNLRCDNRNAMIIHDPEAYALPSLGPSTNYIFCKEDYFF